MDMKSTSFVTMAVALILFSGCFGGCAGFHLQITPNKTTLKSIPGGKNRIEVDHPQGSKILVEVDLIGSIADTITELYEAFEKPITSIIGFISPSATNNNG